MILSLLYFAICSTFSLEATGGLALPGLPVTGGPAVYCEFKGRITVTENWSVFASVPFWKLSNFDPSSYPPELSEQFQYSGLWNYSECRRALQIGVGRRVGPISLETAVGIVKRRASYSIAGPDTDGCGEMEYNDNHFLGSLGIVIPTGDFAHYNLGLRIEDFSDWFVTAGAGLNFSFSRGGV